YLYTVSRTSSVTSTSLPLLNFTVSSHILLNPQQLKHEAYKYVRCSALMLVSSSLFPCIGLGLYYCVHDYVSVSC
ncbi:MAG: hypothetical protein QW417_07555, partial [Zestosphaera sp.]